MKKDERKTNRTVAILFAALLAGFFVFNLIHRDSDRSAFENRSLTQRPSFTWQAFADGTFADEFEAYESDQFTGRSLFRVIDTWIRRIGGRREEGSIFLGKKQQLLEEIVIPDDTTMEAHAESLNRFADSHSDIATYILLVPDAAEILEDTVPSYVTFADQGELFRAFEAELNDGIVWMDGISSMKKSEDEKLYYQTDSLWTTEGAYRVFLETAGDLGIEDPYGISYTTNCAVYDFNGSLAHTSGFLTWKREEINVFLPKENISCLVTFGNGTVTSPSLYDIEALDGEDPYAVFLGGDQALITIDTAADNDRTLLVVKDSFADCFIPFLVPYYSRILVVDPAYTGDGTESLTGGYGGIDALIEDYGVTDTLFLYGGNSFFEDSSLQGFLGLR